MLTFRGRSARCSHYFPDWPPITDRVNAEREPLGIRDRPEGLDEMLAIARRLGAACGTFMRVDLYDTASGRYFGEFSSAPHWGGLFSGDDDGPDAAQPPAERKRTAIEGHPAR